MNAKDFKQEIRLTHTAIVKITEDDFVSVTARRRGFDCRLVRSLDDNSDASALIAEYTADNFTEIVALAREARKEYKGAPIQYA